MRVLQVVLDFAQALRIVLRPGSEQLLDALLATRVRPFAAQIVRIVVAVNALVGGGRKLSTDCCGNFS